MKKTSFVEILQLLNISNLITFTCFLVGMILLHINLLVLKGNKGFSPTLQVIKYEYKVITLFVDFIRWVKVKYSQKRMVNVKFIFYTVCIK